MEIYESSVLSNDMLTKKNPKKMHANLIKYQVENCLIARTKCNFHMES